MLTAMLTNFCSKINDTNLCVLHVVYWPGEVLLFFLFFYNKTACMSKTKKREKKKISNTA